MRLGLVGLAVVLVLAPGGRAIPGERPAPTPPDGGSADLAFISGLVGLVVVVLHLDIPPPRLILKYGYPSPGGQTGRTRVIEGITFKEVSPGYFYVRRNVWIRKGDLLGRICRPLGIPLGSEHVPGPSHEDRWIEIHEPVWIGRTTLDHLIDLAALYGGKFMQLWYQKPFCDTFSSKTFGRVRWPTPEEMYFAVAVGLLPDSGYLVELIRDEKATLTEGWVTVLVGVEWAAFEGSVFEVLLKQLEDVQMAPFRLKAEHDPSQIRLLVWVPEGDEIGGDGR